MPQVNKVAMFYFSMSCAGNGEYIIYGKGCAVSFYLGDHPMAIPFGIIATWLAHLSIGYINGKLGLCQRAGIGDGMRGGIGYREAIDLKSVKCSGGRLSGHDQPAGIDGSDLA